jgi:VWFA-related protein
MRTLLAVLLLSSTALAQMPGQSPANSQASSQPGAHADAPQAGSSNPSQSYTLKAQSNVVLVPTTVQTKHGDMIYGLKPEQFVVEDNGVPQTVHVDEDTDALGLSLVVVVQCSRSAGWEFPKLSGLGTMIEGITGGAPREVAVVEYGSAPLLLGKFSSRADSLGNALSQLQPCDDPDASTLDAVAYATRLLEARQNHYRHAILLISETRDHGSTTKAAQVIAALGRTNTVVDSVAFSPGKNEVMSDLKYGGGSGPIGLLIMAINGLKKNAAREMAALSGGEYINFTNQKGFDNGLHQLSNHVHNYYLLSFQPHSEANGSPARGMHVIRVKIPDYPDARIRFRQSYFSGELDAAEANTD